MKINKLKQVLSIGEMTIGTFLMAMGVNLFLRPAALFAGGIAGMAVVLLHIIGTQYYVYFGILIFGLQSLCIIVQLFFFGFAKIFKGIVTSVLFSIMTQVTVAPTAGVQISDNILLMALGGSILIGLGIGVVLISGFRFIGFLGIAEIISNKLGIPMGKSVLYLESLVLLGGAFIIGIEHAMVSAIGLYIISKTINSVAYGMNQYKQLLIITTELDSIRKALTVESSEYASVILTENAKLGEMRNLLFIIIRNDKYKQSKNIVRCYDPKAFVVVSDVNELVGGGFKML
jgi:uncharacterized membrane-anchored protein YitT (DUF2179 family)